MLQLHGGGQLRVCDLPDSLRVSDPPNGAAAAIAPPERPGAASQAQGIELRTYGDLSPVKAAWTRFEAHADCTPFQTFARLSKWQAHIGARRGVQPAIVTGADADGALLFILPLAVERRHGIRRLTWLGSELSDYNAPLLGAGFEERCAAGRFRTIWGGIVKHLQADARFRSDLVELVKMPARVGAQDNPFISLDVAPNPSGAHLAHLGSDWEAYYAGRRSSATRKRERRQVRQLAEFGEVSFARIDDAGEIASTLDILFEQKGRAFLRKGVPDVFSRPGYRPFYLDLATDPSTRDGVHLSVLKVGGTVAAVGLGLLFRSCFSTLR